MWDDIRTWIKNNRFFVLPDLAVEIPSSDEYRVWKKILETKRKIL